MIGLVSVHASILVADSRISYLGLSDATVQMHGCGHIRGRDRVKCVWHGWFCKLADICNRVCGCLLCRRHLSGCGIWYLSIMISEG